MVKLIQFSVPAAGICWIISTFVLLSPSFLMAKSLLSRVQIAPFMEVSELSGGDDIIPGLRVKTVTFKTKKGNKEIADYYKAFWKGKIKSVEGPRWYYHSNFDGEYLIVVQVKKQIDSVSKSFAGRETFGLISISQPDDSKPENKISKVERFYPLASGVKVLSDLSTVDFGKKSRTTVYDVPGGVSSNLRYYQSHFERKGWHEAYSDMASEMVRKFGGASLIMQKGSDELVLSFIPDKNGRTKVVGVYVDK